MICAEIGRCQNDRVDSPDNDCDCDDCCLKAIGYDYLHAPLTDRVAQDPNTSTPKVHKQPPGPRQGGKCSGNCPVSVANMKCASYRFVMTVVGPVNCTGHDTQVHLSFETTGKSEQE